MPSLLQRWEWSAARQPRLAFDFEAHRDGVVCQSHGLKPNALCFGLD